MLVLHLLHSSVTVAVVYPDGAGEITTVSVVSHGSVTVTVVLPRFLVLVVYVV